MEKFTSNTWSSLNQKQIDILRQHSDIISYKNVCPNECMVLTKKSDMRSLKNKLFSEQKKCTQSKRETPLMDLKIDSAIPNLQSESPTIFHHRITAREEICMFSIDTFEKRLRDHFKETFNVQLSFERSNNDQTKGNKSHISIEITGQKKNVNEANQNLEDLFSSLQTKQYDERSNGNWTKIEEVTQIFEYHLREKKLLCACERISPTCICLYYFDEMDPHFGIDTQELDDLIDQFKSTTIDYDQKSVSSQFLSDWKVLENEIQESDDYLKNICFDKETNCICLFGLIRLVNNYYVEFEKIKEKNCSTSCKVTLSQRQLHYLTCVVKSDLNKLQQQYESDGYEVKFHNLLRTGKFLAPTHIHKKINDTLHALAEICEDTFEVDEPGFEKIVENEFKEVLSLAKSKCYVEKSIDSRRILMPIPKSRICSSDVEIKRSQSTGAMSDTSSNIKFTIAHSKVTIKMDDLAKEAVDGIVVCSSSNALCQTILEKGGDPVKNEYLSMIEPNQLVTITNGGALPCKKIFFVSWSCDSPTDADIKSSFQSYMTIVFMQAIVEECKSIAFSTVGCESSKYDRFLIAKHMLNETKNQIKEQKLKMDISFVHDNKNVYDAFIQQFLEMEKIDLNISLKTSTNQKDDKNTICFDKKFIKLTLISGNRNNTTKCKHNILEFAKSCSIKKKFDNKKELNDWSQETIHKYYQYCLERRVIPKIEIENLTLELHGLKDLVNDAERYFYELSSESMKQAHIEAVSRGVIWSFELSPNSNTWEQYSFKINGIIEDAFLRKYPHIDFNSENDEHCKIVFSEMKEHQENQKRRINRKVIDSVLPDTWINSDENCKRVQLQTKSKEFQDVLGQFLETMLGKYSQIVRIERIQNERWFKQYAAHRDDFKRRYSTLNERLLFHGCSVTSADNIIQGCFNRSYAGVNGVLYGHGVYFHTDASYSHQYAPMNSSGERTIFLTRVLIGKTCKGDKTMKVAPPGYDTTTDGEKIFVVYHDAGAYAEHLITYK